MPKPNPPVGASEERHAADFSHDAFISYSRVDTRFARLLERALESYRPPKLLGVPRRRLRVFRDEQDLIGAGYFESVEAQLRASRKLLLLCSPDAASSAYVNDEVRRFAALRGGDNIVPVLLAGVPNNEAGPNDDAAKAFPPALMEALELPLAIDYSGFDPDEHRLNRASYQGPWYSVAASLLDVSREEIEERDKKRRSKRRAMAIVAGGLAVLLVFGTAYLHLRRQIEQQAAEIIGFFDPDERLSESETTGLWRIAHGSDALRRAVVSGFLASDANAQRLETHAPPILQALFGLDPKRRGRPLAGLIREACTERLRMQTAAACLSLVSGLDRLPAGFDQAVSRVIGEASEKEIDALTEPLTVVEPRGGDAVGRWLSLASERAPLSESVIRAIASRTPVEERQRQLVENMERPREFIASAAELAGLGTSLDPELALRAVTRLAGMIENAKRRPHARTPITDHYRRLESLRKSLAALAQHLGPEQAGVAWEDVVLRRERASELLPWENRQTHTNDRFRALSASLTPIAGRLSPADAGAIADRLAASMERGEPIGLPRQTWDALVGRLDDHHAKALGQRLVRVMEQEPRLVPVARLEALVDRLEGDSGSRARALIGRLSEPFLLSLMEEEDDYLRDEMVSSFVSYAHLLSSADAEVLGERLIQFVESAPPDPVLDLDEATWLLATVTYRYEPAAALALADRVVAQMEAATDPGRRAALAAVIPALMSRLDEPAVRSLVGHLMTGIESGAGVSRSQLLLGLTAQSARLGPEAASTLCSGLMRMRAVRLPENSVPALVARLDPADAVLLAGQLIGDTERQPRAALADLELWLPALRERVDAASGRDLDSRLVRLVGRIEDGRQVGRLVGVLAALGDRLAEDDATEAAALLVARSFEDAPVHELGVVARRSAAAGRLLAEEVLKWPTLSPALRSHLIQSLATGQGREPAELGFVADAPAGYRLDRYRFAAWARSRGFDITSPPALPASLARTAAAAALRGAE